MASVPSTSKPPKPSYAPPVLKPAASTPQISIEIPYLGSSAFPMSRLDGKLDLHQARALRLIFDGLAQQRATLKDGHPIRSPLDAVRWILERASEAIPAEVLNAA